MKKLLYLIGFLIFAFHPSGICQITDSNVQIGFIEKQGQYVALDTKLVNEQGDTVILKDLIDKPTILNLVYFRCPGTCSPLMFGINKFIQEVDLDFGVDYQVLTISFDPTETIKLGIGKKASYINLLEDKSLADGWHFFVTDSMNIAKITESAGFQYMWVNDQYSHPTGLIALSPDGKITRYLRGIEFPAFDIKMTMVEAGQGKVGPSINRLLAFCYSYDKDEDQMVLNITKISGTLIIFFGIVIFLILLFYRRKTT